MSLRKEVEKVLQNLSGKEVPAYDTLTELLHGFNNLYVCMVTFVSVTDDVTIVVTLDNVVIQPEVDGKYALEEGTYEYSVSKEGYVSKIDQTLTITNSDETTGSKTINIGALESLFEGFSLNENVNGALFDTTKTPDLSIFNYGETGALLIALGDEPFLIAVNDNVNNTYALFSKVGADLVPLYASGAFDLDDMGIHISAGDAGWQSFTNPIIPVVVRKPTVLATEEGWNGVWVKNI